MATREFGEHNFIQCVCFDPKGEFLSEFFSSYVCVQSSEHLGDLSWTRCVLIIEVSLYQGFFTPKGHQLKWHWL